MSDLARASYNHIDKFDFLAEYARARTEAFQPHIIQNSFATTSLILVDVDRVLSKLNISLRTPSPPNSRPYTSYSQFSPKTPRTIV